MTLGQVWSSRQRQVIFIFVISIACFLLVEYLRQPVNVPDPPPEMGARASEVADRLDPNLADAAALSAIPQMGEKRAAEIVVYREEFSRGHPGQAAFKEPRDLLKLKNFGVSTVANVGPYLLFPATKPVSETQSN